MRAFHVTFVCSGNICRSPMGEIVLRDMLEDAGLADTVTVDSAGTTRWEAGNPMDPRAVRELHRHGYDGSAHIARQFQGRWFSEADLVLAADQGHVRDLRRLAPTRDDAEKVRLMRTFDPEAVADGTVEIDDPWYGEEEDFVRCFEEVEAACRGLLPYIRDKVRR